MSHRWFSLVNPVRCAAELSSPRSSHTPTVDGKAMRGYPKLFVVGCGRSGTTWLLKLLARHPRILATNESHAYNDVAAVLSAPAARRLPARLAFARVLHRYDVVRRAKPWVGLHWYVTRDELRAVLRRRLDEEHPDRDVAADLVIEDVFDQFMRRSNATIGDVFVEKTPGHLYWAPRILDGFPGARMIEVVRDGRDVALSMQAFATTQRWAPTQRQRQFEVWRDAIRAGQRLHADPRYAERVRRVRYEDLLAAPEATLAALLDFAGLPTDPATVALIVDSVQAANVPIRGEGRTVNRAAAGGWRDLLTKDDLASFEEIAGPEAAQCGYL